MKTMTVSAMLGALLSEEMPLSLFTIKPLKPINSLNFVKIILLIRIERVVKKIMLASRVAR